MAGYYKGYQKDNINFPLLNDCTYKCRDKCMQCSSYDRCMFCKTGLYGPICEKRCSAGCMSNTCDILTGNCECFSNFAGVRCDKCTTGKYGNMCDKQCPEMCKGSVCDKDSGECTNGCITNTIIGDKCDVCSTGWYGQYCTMSCSVGCKNQTCEKSNGECSYGCLDNFVGGQCNQCISDSSCSSEQSAVILLGTIIGVSVLVNILFVVASILRKCRKRANGNSNTKGTDYDNSCIELECGNAGNVSNHRIDHASNGDKATNSDTMFKSHDYEDLGTIQVSEHEY
ncbi:multiple epidermal growth factor-like domains protein 10 [Ruditapes philippinarum]|uniref:multiple epidermal growth factor-like domains protein 10 n=1 Tax=Ruditapes philippinarum TaxID=129788 RepID=UPI00295AB0D8|nr:multiple epidermal growth factor-like domains protein 10 [Ruditapes philippinarum]